MKLKSTSLFAKVYIWFYEELPENLCPLFWNTLLTVLLFPLVIISRLLDMTAVFQTDSDFWKKTALTRAMAALFYLLIFHCFMATGSGAACKIFDLEFTVRNIGYWKLIGLGLLFWSSIALMLLVVVGSLAYIVHLIECSAKRKAEAKYKIFEELSDEQKAEYYDYKEKKKEPSKFRILWDTFLNKYCTKIDWE